jgi:ATP-dependent DNA helicase RecQ
MQEEIILSVLEQKNTLALLPTGGGKSICYQLPGLALGGTTLVVSPLIALMNDQVKTLKKKGLSAVAITSAMNYKEIEIALNNAALGHVQFLYVSPERLENEDFRKQLSYLPIQLIAVDEAHCISQWGYDFRPSYLNIARVKEYFKQITVIAVTASATPPIVEDILKKLELEKPVVFRQSFERKNLRYVVQLEENKTERLLKIINNIGGSGIIYLKNRKKTEDISAWLNRVGISATFYHAGLKNSVRSERQEKWITNEVRVIVATNAFGMGIDKPDVRFVVNMDLPDSIESYFQEAGRAGRDGKTSYSVLFYTKKDEAQLWDNLELAFPDLETIRNSYNAVCNFYQVAIGAGEGLSVDFDIDEVSRLYKLHPVLLYNSIRFLEKENYVSLLDAGYEPAKCFITMHKEDLYNFQIKFPKHESLLKTLMRSYGGILEQYVHINEKELAYRIKNTAAFVTEQLEFLQKQEVLSYVRPSELPKLIFLRPRVTSKHIELDKKNYDFLKERQKEKIQQVIAFANETNICRQVFLLHYFGEDDAQACGFCDVCLSKKTKNSGALKSEIRKVLSEGTIHIDDLKEKLIKYNDERWTEALNEMIDDGNIQMDQHRNLTLIVDPGN